jgi:hypothetical protein
MLEQINAPLVGTVLNRAPETDSYTYYHYGYEQRFSDKKQAGPTTAAANGNGNGNGNGKLATTTSQVKTPSYLEVENAEWPAMGRHAKAANPTGESPNR